MNYGFSDSLSEQIVRGILKGYKSYLGERREKKNSMKISSAYAWVKGNHIEDAVANTCSPNNLEYISSKAGYTWGYLQFVNEEEKVLFIIKNGGALKRSILTNRKKEDENNYLMELSNINSDLTIFEEQTINKDVETSGQMCLQLFDNLHSPENEEELREEIRQIQGKYNRFYIVTYEIDEGKMISSINLYLPAPGLSKFYLVSDWTDLIDKAGIEFGEEDFASVKDESSTPPEEFTSGNYIIGRLPQLVKDE
ncbi:spr1630 family ClpXP-sensitive toxin [Bacillus paralicheniformis]|uniref:spr1630 family ClpXP-sensitive toxin n=1 Tax=Bacillus paralicheniformis TaxID=1648923 RepID=UPI00189AE128|nr:hypothetical protein [Bacillus paralicheniformis]